MASARRSSSGTAQGFVSVAWQPPEWEGIATELDAALEGYQPAASLQLGTVADLISRVMADLLQARQPSLDDIATVLAAIQEGRDIYRPAESISLQLRRFTSSDGVSLALVNHMTDASRPSSTRLRRSSSAPMFDAMRTASDCAEPGEGPSVPGNEVQPPTPNSELLDACAPLSKQLTAVIQMASPLDSEHCSSMSGVRRLSISCLLPNTTRVRRWSVEMREEGFVTVPMSPAPSSEELGFISCGSLGRNQLGYDAEGHHLLPQFLTERMSPYSSTAADPNNRHTPSTVASRRFSRASCDSTGRLTPLPPAVLIDEVQRDLAAAQQWQWDAFQLADSSRGHALSTLGYYLFHQEGLIQHFHIKPVKLARFLRRIEEGYRDVNPYHNATHAADVLQSMHVLLKQGGLVPGFVAANSLVMMACYVAAIVHDFEHPGVNADFLINTSDPLAVRYNDKQPLENHHAAAAFALLAKPEYNFLETLTRAQFATFRKLVIDLVLATDMKSHYSLLGQFNAQFNTGATAKPPMCAQTAPASTTQTSPPAAGLASSPSLSSLPSVPRSELQLTLALQMAIKISDLGHTAAGLPVHCKWVDCLQEELFRQGDIEAAHGLQVSPMCDRSEMRRMQRGQLAFFDVVVIPLFKAFSLAFPSSSPLVTNAMRNRTHWSDNASGPLL